MDFKNTKVENLEIVGKYAMHPQIMRMISLADINFMISDHLPASPFRYSPVTSFWLSAILNTRSSSIAPRKQPFDPRVFETPKSPAGQVPMYTVVGGAGLKFRLPISCVAGDPEPTGSGPLWIVAG